MVCVFERVFISLRGPKYHLQASSSNLRAVWLLHRKRRAGSTIWEPWLQRQQSVHLLHVELHKHTGLYMVKIWLKIFNSCIYSEVVLKDSHLKWEKILHHSIFTAVFAKLPFFVLGITSVRFCFLLIWHYKKNKNTCCCQSLTHLRPNKNNQIFLEMYFMEIVFAFSIENSGIM